jgi:hypothetical protein
MTHKTMADFFAGLPRQMPEAALPLTVYAAVIEWGVPYDDKAPTLIMARTRDEARQKARDAVAAMSEELDGEEPEWDAALSEPGWGDFKYALCDAQSGVFITEYEQEV